MTDVIPEPGDLVVVNTMNQASAAIELIEWISTRKFSQWNHVAVCTRVQYAGQSAAQAKLHGSLGGVQIWIAEAEPGGAVEVPWHYENVPHVWSTGIIANNPKVAEAAIRYTQPGPWGDHGVPYGWPDYAAIAAHRYHIPAPGLKAFIGQTWSMICSQLADQCKLDGGIHLFNDGRWPGYVAPDDIGNLLPPWQPA